MSDFLQKQAPNFTLKDQHQEEHTLSEYRGGYLLLYFYPKDMTPGCTTEAKGFQEMLSQLQDAGVQVVGVSGDTCESHKQFALKHHLNFPLLADTEHEVVKMYDVFQQKSMFGKTFMGIERQSFLIDPDGIIVKHYTKVDPKRHPQEVFDDVRALGGEPSESEAEKW